MEITKEFLKNCKSISNVIFTFEFEIVEQIQREIYKFETHFKKLFPDEAIDTRVPPDYNPSTPRFILRHDKKKRYLEVSQDRAVLKFVITDSHATTPSKGLDFFKQRCKSVLESIQTIIKPKFYRLNSSTHLNYSMQGYDQKKLTQFYSNRFLNHNNIAPPNKFTFSAYYEKNENYMVSLNFQEYETMQLKIESNKLPKPTPGSSRFIRLNKNNPAVEIQDYGLKIIVDVNNSLKTKVAEFDNNPSLSLEEISNITLEQIENMENFLL